MDQQVKQWLDYAAQDLGVARHLFENYHPKPLEIRLLPLPAIRRESNQSRNCFSALAHRDSQKPRSFFSAESDSQLYLHPGCNRRCCRCPNAIWYHDTISERTDCRGASCKAGNRICRADSKLDSICFAIKQKSQLHNRSGRRLATAFFCILQKNRIAALFYK